ncbi:DUF6401 family natural product biosynthesis protein [Streptomyces sp. TRM64462]|uniref:DUF6401 family natural product biosynthesis protein n=1 Tax=Streptomyces sp. TRM64462 TaxID=2741726 RepID=UPI002815F115|nr:DUF6401 family natural product biosynthesis protein [Streptomyces sp. TRM64462]
MPCLSPLAAVATTYTPRLAEFAFEPGFVAAVDQHVAELRERIGADGPGLVPPAPDEEALSDYALGFLDALAETGWDEPPGHDYAVCRLTAVCWLIRRYDLLGDRPGTGRARDPFDASDAEKRDPGPDPDQDLDLDGLDLD